MFLMLAYLNVSISSSLGHISNLYWTSVILIILLFSFPGQWLMVLPLTIFTHLLNFTEYLGFVLGSCTGPLTCEYVIQLDLQDTVAYQLRHCHLLTKS